MTECVWAYNEDGFYDTGCDNAFEFSYSKREEGFKYCPYCGLEIKEEGGIGSFWPDVP